MDNESTRTGKVNYFLTYIKYIDKIFSFLLQGSIQFHFALFTVLQSLAL